MLISVITAAALPHSFSYQKTPASCVEIKR